MTSINDKLGLKRPGKRAMMQLPKNLAARARITSAICPTCGRTGARPHPKGPTWVFCSWCATRWELTERDVDGRQ